MRFESLRSDHLVAVLDFELANRAYFARSISDRGDEFFERFSERYHELLAEQDAGAAAFHVLQDDDGAVVGRFNLYELKDGTANVGYRVAERAAGRGVATAGLQELCLRAAGQYGLSTLRAVTSKENVASQRVLEKAGFVSVGESDVAGRPGIAYERAIDQPRMR